MSRGPGTVLATLLALVLWGGATPSVAAPGDIALRILGELRDDLPKVRAYKGRLEDFPEHLDRWENLCYDLSCLPLS